MASQEASPREGLGEEDLGKLYEALYCVRTSYKPIGLQIGVKKSEIESAEKKETDPGDRLLEILSIRVKKAKVLTWKDIVEALRSQCVGEGKVAEEIQNKYGLAAASEGTTSKEHEKQAQFNERESEKSKQSTEGDPPMNKEKVSDKQGSDSEGEGSERVKRKVHPEKPHSKTKRKGEKVKEVRKTQKRLEVVESNDENLNERKRKRRSKQKGEPPLYQEEVSDKQDSDLEGESSERVKRKIHSEKPRSKTTRKGEKVREKAEMSVACSPEQEVELAKKKEGNVEKKESFKQGEKERGTENKLQRNMKAVREKDNNFGKETVSDSHTEQEVNTQTQAVIVESDDEYFTASSGAEMESTQFQNKTKKEASPQYAKGESHLKGAMKKSRGKDKYSSAAGEETESEDESSYARVSKEEEGSKAQSPEPRRKPMPKVRTPKPVHTETIGSSWSKVSKRSNEKAEQSAPSSMYHSKGSRPKDRAQKVEKKGKGIPSEKKAAIVPLELATDDRSQEECKEEQEWDSDERSEEEGDEDSEQEESEPGSEHNQVEKKRGRGISSEKKAAAVPLEPTSDDIIEEESGEETRDLDDRSEDEDSEQKLSSEEEEAGSNGESSPATSEEEEKRIAAQPERRKHVKGKTSTENASATASRYDVPEQSDPSPRGGVKGAKKKKKKKIKHKEREMDQAVKPSSSLSTSPEERPKQPTSRGQRRKTGQREGKKGKSEKRRRRAEGLMVMSSSETDDSTSPECDMSKNFTKDEVKKISKVFKQFFGQLCCTIVNPVEIAAQLQRKHLISQKVMMDMLNSPETKQAKTISLVLKLSKRIESRPYRMYRFIEVLLGNSVLLGAGREILRETGM